MEMLDVIYFTAFTVILFVLAPFLGMLAMGLSRKMGARMQNRVGPPVAQPWYDVQKLLMKKDTASSDLIGAFAFAFFIFNALAVVLLVTLGDLLMVMILLGVAQLFLCLGAFAGSSPYSHLGANRNLLQVLSVEPMMILVAVGILLINGNYFVKDLAWNAEVLLFFPVAIPVLIFSLVVWMQKGPYDLSTAHQELAYGTLSEFSGKNLALVELGHWFETFGLLALFSLFFNFAPLLEGTTGVMLAVIIDLFLKLFIGGLALLLIVWIDNASARLHWDRLPKFAFTVMLPLVFLNLVMVYSHFVWGWF